MSEFDDIFADEDLSGDEPAKKEQPASSGKKTWNDSGKKYTPKEPEPVAPKLAISVHLNKGMPPDKVQRLGPILDKIGKTRFTVRIMHTGDQQVDKIINEIDKKELFLLWKGIEIDGVEQKEGFGVNVTGKNITMYYNPRWDSMSKGAQLYAARAAHLVLGQYCTEFSRALVIWTPDGTECIDDCTDQSKYMKDIFKLCSMCNIPIINIQNEDGYKRLMHLLSKHIALEDA